MLFQMLTDHGMPVQGGPVGVMLMEHEQGRVFTRGCGRPPRRWKLGDVSAKKQVIENARGYAQLLRQHIYKEDHVLFPAADRVIPLAEQDLVLRRFETVEHEETGEGVHEKYLALAQALEKEMAKST